MATVTRLLFAADDDLAKISYSYDDQTLLIGSVVVQNNSPRAFYAELRRNTDNSLIWSGQVLPVGQTANPPTTLAPGTYSVAAQNLHVVQVTEGGLTYLMPPYYVYGRWPA